jgi:hypothetical protein
MATPPEQNEQQQTSTTQKVLEKLEDHGKVGKDVRLICVRQMKMTKTITCWLKHWFIDYLNAYDNNRAIYQYDDDRSGVWWQPIRPTWNVSQANSRDLAYIKQWTTDSGQWKVDNGQRTMDNAQHL